MRKSIDKALIPYFEAVRKIMDGTAVKELDEIRERCNGEYIARRVFKKGYMKRGDDPSDYPGGYNPENVVLTFVGDAENRILQGENPNNIYGRFKDISVEECRKRGREVVENMLKAYLD